MALSINPKKTKSKPLIINKNKAIFLVIESNFKKAKK